ncbi:MAG: flavin reductase family protein [candidate division KSB1 bacterium]|nr:flavin reductase family protein [candidate division KSB1 bacterium]
MVEVPLRRANRLLNPGCVVFVTAHHGGRSNFMPAAWVTPVSHEPPLCAVSVAPKRFTHDLIGRSREFGLSVPGLDLAEKVAHAGDISGSEVQDKFAAVGLTAEPGVRIRAPRIAECLGHLECVVEQAVTVGDHTLFVGRIVAAFARPEAFGETWLLPDAPNLRPLHHLGGDWFAVLEKPLQIVFPGP